MNDNKIIEFFKNNIGFFIGLIVGAIVILCDITYVFINLLVMGACGFLGLYVQKNKRKVKETLKNLIDKI